MKKCFLLLMLLIIPLYPQGSTSMDTVLTYLEASKVYYPFDLDTVAAGDSAISVWYYLNAPNLVGYMSYTFEAIKIAGSNNYIKLYKEFHNDTMWISCHSHDMVDSIITTPYRISDYSTATGSAFIRWKVVNYGTGADESTYRLKFTVK